MRDEGGWVKCIQAAYLIGIMIAALVLACAMYKG